MNTTVLVLLAAVTAGLICAGLLWLLISRNQPHRHLFAPVAVSDGGIVHRAGFVANGPSGERWSTDHLSAVLWRCQICPQITVGLVPGEWTIDDLLRQPSFLGLPADLPEDDNDAPAVKP